MPRFFIHTDDGDHHQHDGEGHDLPSLEAARKAALSALPDMARDKIPDGDRRVFTAAVEDEQGVIVYAASLTLAGEWKVDPKVGDFAHGF